MKPLIGGWREDEAKFHVQEAKVGNSSPRDWDTLEMEESPSLETLKTQHDGA